MKLLVVAAVRTRMEKLADKLWQDKIYRRPMCVSAYRRPMCVSASEAFRAILTSEEPKYRNHPRIQKFRKQFGESNIDIEDFLGTCRKLGDRGFSDRPDYKMSAVAQPPRHDDVEAITEMLGTAGITPDASTIASVQIFLKPLP